MLPVIAVAIGRPMFTMSLSARKSPIAVPVVRATATTSQ